MPDQAHGLRALAHRARRIVEFNDLEKLESYEHAAVITPRRAARTIAITSGKGGVGKTNISTNLALLLGQRGARVVLIDADLGLANLHMLLGVSPRLHLDHVIRGEHSLRDILYPISQGVQIVAGGSGIAELANLSDEQRRGFVTRLSELDDSADVVLIDTGAGISNNVLAFVLAVEEVIVVTTPEPTAIADAYATIKVISRNNPESRVRLIVNMASGEAEADATAERLKLVAKQFLDFDLESLGFVPIDPAVPRAVRAQRPLVLEHPESPAVRKMGGIANALAGIEANPRGAAGFVNRLSRFFQASPA